MARIQYILLGLLSLCYIDAAPSDLAKAGDATTISDANPTEQEKLTLFKDIESHENETQNQRQKRQFNHYGYGFPPISPIIYPSYAPRDESYYNTGVYGLDDAFTDIFRRVQEIASVARQQPPPPPATNNFPLFYPVIYIPLFDCRCTPGSGTASPSPDPPKTNNSVPDIDDRFLEIDDVRRNWGFALNQSSESEGTQDDFSRPISFEPIKPNRTVSRPLPPVEHGTSQAGSDAPSINRVETNKRENFNTQSSLDPLQPNPSITVPSPSVQLANSNSINSLTEFTRPISFQPVNSITPTRPFPPVEHGSSQAGGTPKPTTYRPPLNQEPVLSNSHVPVANTNPSLCDGAILVCCHRPEVTYDCFVSQGCPNTSSYGADPCSPNVILSAIAKFQLFYNRRTG